MGNREREISHGMLWHTCLDFDLSGTKAYEAALNADGLLPDYAAAAHAARVLTNTLQPPPRRTLTAAQIVRYDTTMGSWLPFAPRSGAMLQTPRASRHAFAGSHKPFATPVLRPSALKMLDGGRDNLLTVREVAARFGVSTATVYELCARGVLAHFKLLNAIPIAPADAAALIGRDRR